MKENGRYHTYRQAAGMKKQVWLNTAMATGLMVLGIVASALAVDYQGADKMVLDGGSRGNVPFPHLQHVETINDCNTCHDLFPETAGIIVQMIAQDRLKPKKVMNSLCVACHREKKTAGLTTGPVTCSKCHFR